MDFDKFLADGKPQTGAFLVACGHVAEFRIFHEQLLHVFIGDPRA
jgi:hypothetical protein